MARSFSAEFLGADGFFTRGPVSASPAVGAALVDLGSNQLGWSPRAVLVAPASAPSNNDNLLSPVGWKSVGTAIGYTPANDALVLHTIGDESIAGVKSFGTSNPTVIGGSIGRGGFIDFSVGGTTAGLSLGGLNRIFPSVSGAIADNALSLGRADYRFAELHVNQVMAGAITASGATVNGPLAVNSSSAALGYHSRFSGAIVADSYGVFLSSLSTGNNAIAYYTSLGTVTGACEGYAVNVAATGGIRNTLRNTNGIAYNLIWSSANHDAYTYHVAGVKECSFGLDYSETQFRVSQSSDLDTPRFTVDLASGNTWVEGAFTSGAVSGTNGSLSAIGANSNTSAKIQSNNSDAFLVLNSGSNANYRAIKFGHGTAGTDWIFGYHGAGVTAGDLALYGPTVGHVFKADGSTEFGGKITTVNGGSSVELLAGASGPDTHARLRLASPGGETQLFNWHLNGFTFLNGNNDILLRPAGVLALQLHNDQSATFAGAVTVGGSIVTSSNLTVSGGYAAIRGTYPTLQLVETGGSLTSLNLFGAPGGATYADLSSDLIFRDGTGTTELARLASTGALFTRGQFVTVGSAGDTRWNRSGDGAFAHQAYYSATGTWQEPIAGVASAAGAKVSFLGATPIARQSVPAAATDAATTQSLCNALRQLVIDFGLAA